MRKIRWDKQATVYLAQSINYIRKESPKNADKVKNEILLKIRELLKTPYMYSPDKYKINNDGNCRCFELHHYRISYVIMETVIIIIRIRHTNQEPQEY